MITFGAELRQPWTNWMCAGWFASGAPEFVEGDWLTNSSARDAWMPVAVFALHLTNIPAIVIRFPPKNRIAYWSVLALFWPVGIPQVTDPPPMTMSCAPFITLTPSPAC